jgi:uncharacterized protein (DUF2236 family)
MDARMLPTDEEAEALVPGPGSVTWGRAADARILIAAGYALVLQVAHPIVGIGVAEHSDFRRDPWKRLLRTLDFTSALIYSEPPVAAAIARDLRREHTRIKGTMPDGSRYHALEPGAFAWVWASLYDATVTAHRHFGDPLSQLQERRLWDEWRRLGRLLGVRERDLPPTLDGYHDYFDAIVGDVLQDNQSVRDVLASLAEPACPRRLQAIEPAWRIGWMPGAHALRLATIGLLPIVLRERLGLRWTLAQDLELRALGAASRATTRVLPRQLRVFGPSYLRWRQSRPGAQRAAA